MTHERQPSEEELRAQIEEEMKRVRVEDVLVQSAVTLVNLAGRKLGDGDLEQAQLGIDGARALAPMLPDEPKGAVQDALAQLQMMYARAAGGAPPAGEPPKPGEPGQPQQPGQPEGGQGGQAEDPERAKARSKLWTPPGT